MHRGPGQKQRDGGGWRGWKAKENCLQLPDKIASQLSGISRAVTPPYCSPTYADRLALAETHTYTFPARSKSTGVPVFANLLFKLSGTIQIPTSQKECVSCISFGMMHTIRHTPLRSPAFPTGNVFSGISNVATGATVSLSLSSVSLSTQYSIIMLFAVLLSFKRGSYQTGVSKRKKMRQKMDEGERSEEVSASVCACEFSPQDEAADLSQCYNQDPSEDHQCLYERVQRFLE
ncbi:hypothetical protein DPX16_9813 [Anabarilius grahami]|uniref:Uncharacterized protein n=1 Tax=Anabarilius grahami TaxID=495550 RepID=A0A3N0Y3T7_ANAGA|nr:hypothetical protein DPX16_9813 [Anabarilius grahami]